MRSPLRHVALLLLAGCSSSSGSSSSAASGLVGSYVNCSTQNNGTLPPQVGSDFSLFPPSPTIEITSDATGIILATGECTLHLTGTDANDATLIANQDCSEKYGDAGAAAEIYLSSGTVALSGGTLTISAQETLGGTGNQTLSGSGSSITTCTRQ